MEFLTDGSWTKRSHVGQAAQNGLNCAVLALEGFKEIPVSYVTAGDVVLFLGSAYTKTQSRYMPPSKGIGLYRELRSMGHRICLVDEYPTSQVSFRAGPGGKPIFFFCLQAPTDEPKQTAIVNVPLAELVSLANARIDPRCVRLSRWWDEAVVEEA